MTLLANFESHLKESQLIRPGEKIFVACSGGPDSLALFYLLATLRKKWKLQLGLVHFNHQLRGRASDADERFVKKLAKTFKISFYGQRGDVKKMAAREKFSEEEAARISRYAFFESFGKRPKSTKVAMAHTLDDQAETVLMRFLQGTGLRGLCGIRPRMEKGKTVFVRPLLGVSKKEILAYLKTEQISFCRDASNLSERYLRNRIRRKLIPFLEKEFNPKVQQALARVPVSISEESQLLADLEEKAWKRNFLRQKGTSLFLSRNFLKEPATLQFRLLDRGLRVLDAKAGIGFDAWQKVRLGLKGARYRHSLPKDIDLILTPSKLMLYKKD